MKYDDAEKAMAKLEELIPEGEVQLVSIPAEADTDGDREYAVEAHLGDAADLQTILALTGIADEAGGSDVAIGRGAINGVNVTFR
jgi:hypothetical protein